MLIFTQTPPSRVLQSARPSQENTQTKIPEKLGLLESRQEASFKPAFISDTLAASAADSMGQGVASLQPLAFSGVETVICAAS
jgi:hypothetical protein